MNPTDTPHVQRDPLYRVVRFLTQLQLRSALRRVDDTRPLTFLFAVFAGAGALALITVVAHATNLPLLFPPLAPSAFILFTTPMAPQASPRNLVLAHALAVVAGMASLHVVDALVPGVELRDPTVLTLHRVWAIALATGLITATMILLRIQHPPAAATALLAAMGFFHDWLQAAGLVVAAMLLALEAIVLVRWLAGLPYPYWQTSKKTSGDVHELSGVDPDVDEKRRRLRDMIYRNR